MRLRVRILVKSKKFYSRSRHVVQLHYTQNYFSKNLLHTSFYGRISSDASADPTLQFCSSAMLVLMIRNLKSTILG